MEGALSQAPGRGCENNDRTPRQIGLQCGRPRQILSPRSRGHGCSRFQYVSRRHKYGRESCGRACEFQSHLRVRQSHLTKSIGSDGGRQPSGGASTEDGRRGEPLLRKRRLRSCMEHSVPPVSFHSILRWKLSDWTKSERGRSSLRSEHFGEWFWFYFPN